MIKKWWMESIGYQIYPMTFYDSNNDGIGDINGIKEKLPYLKSLGVNLIWICPFYKSPMDDNGYDVSDYKNVNAIFGTLEDFKKLIIEAKKLDIKIILDFVLNHTSDEHPWFIESRKNKDNKYRNYYIWKKGRIIQGEELPPTNWGSFFGGSAWKKDENTGEYYLKIFSDKMPDLNWKNNEVIEEIVDIGKFWLDLGIDGFRIDAVSHLEKDEFIDSNLSEEIVLDWFKFSNLPNVKKYLKILNKKLFSKYDALTIGEVGGEASINIAKDYSAFDSNALSMVFNFDHNWCNNLSEIKSYQDLKVNLNELKKVFKNWQVAFENDGWLPLNWLNHDQPRLVNHYGDLKYHKESAKMLATALYLMRGTPFIYQGEEIGMTNYPFKKFADFKDISSISHYMELKETTQLSEDEIIFKVGSKSRDNARTVMQWDDSYNAGFTKGFTEIKINPNYKEINVLNNSKDIDSILNYYKKIFNLRTKSIYKNVLIYGSYTQIDTENINLYIYKRTDLEYNIYIVCSFSDKTERYKKNNGIEIILNNYETVELEGDYIKLKPYQALVYLVNK